MPGFTPNPIVVRENGRPFKLVELSFEPQGNSFFLEILNEENSLIQRTEIFEESLIAVDKKGDYFIFVCKDKDNNILFQDTVSLLEEKEEKVDVQTLENEKKLVQLIKNEMDFPSGTKDEIEHHTHMLKRATMDKNARNYVLSKIRRMIIASNLINDQEVEKWTYKLYANLYGMGVLQKLDDDPSIGEIMVNAVDFPVFRADIYYIKNGRKYRYNKSFKNLDDMMQVFGRSIEFSNKELNSYENALVEATRANKDRVNIIIPDASDNYLLNIRKFSNFLPNLESMRKAGTIDDFLNQLLSVLVRGKTNIGIGGEMGTGKTTLINYLLTYTEPIERKVVIGSVSETDINRVLKGHDVAFLKVDEDKNFTFKRLIKASLRTTASRVIIPESRGDEFRQVYEANLKTKGNMFTAHALEDYAFLDACVDMYLGDGSAESSEHVKNKLAKAIDVVIIMRTVGDQIRLKSLSEIVLDEKKNFKQMNLLYFWNFDPENPNEGWYERTNNRMTDDLKRRLNENGIQMSQLKNF